MRTSLSARPSSLLRRLGVLALLGAAGPAFTQPEVAPLAEDRTQAHSLSEIQRQRWAGRLDEARRAVESRLATGTLAPRDALDLRLELATIHDRIGLHQNTRPVVAALEQIEVATSLARNLGTAELAQVAYARGKYYYRAEMAERQFVVAEAELRRALDLYRQAGDVVGTADATHALGLVFFQRRQLEQAEELFERSLELDREGGERPLLRADYERHVGFVYLVQDDLERALPYFERSLAFRRAAEAHDPALFAATTLASTLTELGRLEEAKGPLLLALSLAEGLDSPVGRMRATLVAATLYERQGDRVAAQLAYRGALRLAEAVASASVAERCREGLERLAEPPEAKPPEAKPSETESPTEP